jgi:hypothetical protein
VGRKTWPGCGNSILIFLFPDEKAARFGRAESGKTLPGSDNCVLYYVFLYHQMKKQQGSFEQVAGKPCREAATVSCTISLSPDKKAARIRRAGSAAAPGGMRRGGGGPAIRQ